MNSKDIFKYLGVLLIGLTFLASCKPDQPMPKPRAYFKIDIPEKGNLKTFDSLGFPYSFQYPSYGFITQDEKLVTEEQQPYWVNVAIPSLNATIYLSYKTITENRNLMDLVNESYKLTDAHKKKADFIEATEIVTPNGLNGMFYTVGGNTASRYQFYVTDKQKHFIRGSLYFNCEPNADSTLPAEIFLRKDIEELMNSIKFR
ncbi:MAG TPA: hypothetical protein PKX92_03990 [Edaphocola sp.]|nr:hypothetical protein [Edaphocola sp.]